jgi:7-carboxy-7-deazaguanine synthase
VDGPGGGKFESADACATAVEVKWPDSTSEGKRFVVCTGGEPLLQLDSALIEAFHTRGFEIAVETNGTVAAPAGIDWLCISPKAGAKLVQRNGDELKLVYPQVGADPADFEKMRFEHFFLQPMDGPSRVANTELAVRYCLEHPKWRLSLQTHKFLGIP